MFRTIAREVWSIDAEWVPDPESGRRAFGLPASMSDEDVVAHMYEEGGATEDEPRPYLRTALCRVVSVAAFIRRREDGERASFELRSIPDLGEGPVREGDLLKRFLDAVGQVKPQLVGYNLFGADLNIFAQRALVNGISVPDFCERPDKPWLGVDYFQRGSEAVIDLMQIFGGWPRAGLHILATAAGVPGKLDTDGSEVGAMWRAGKVDAIVEYNRCDVLTTYLLWLRAAHMAGFVTTEAYEREQEQFESHLVTAIGAGSTYLSRFRDEWTRLRESLHG